MMPHGERSILKLIAAECLSKTGSNLISPGKSGQGGTGQGWIKIQMELMGSFLQGGVSIVLC